MYFCSKRIFEKNMRVIKEIIYESIEEELGQAFTPDIAKAWNTALDIIIDAMDV